MVTILYQKPANFILSFFLRKEELNFCILSYQMDISNFL